MNDFTGLHVFLFFCKVGSTGCFFCLIIVLPRKSSGRYASTQKQEHISKSWYCTIKAKASDKYEVMRWSYLRGGRMAEFHCICFKTDALFFISPFIHCFSPLTLGSSWTGKFTSRSLSVAFGNCSRGKSWRGDMITKLLIIITFKRNVVNYFIISAKRSFFWLHCWFDCSFQVKEREGNYSEAINLYLKAGLPAKAARLAMSREVHSPVLALGSCLVKGERGLGIEIRRFAVYSQQIKSKHVLFYVGVNPFVWVTGENCGSSSERRTVWTGLLVSQFVFY